MDVPLVEVRELKKYFPVRRGFAESRAGFVRAVDKVDFSINKGEILALVGESGCGKTTTGRLLLRLIDKTDGTVLFKGENIYNAGKDELRNLRKKMQVIFQNPYSSLNPRFRVGSLLSEVLRFHNIVSKSDIKSRIKELFEQVDISVSSADKYPFEFSGGQLQRIAIARALALEPDFIVADEPVSALDVSVQAQIINLLKSLKEKYGIAFLSISHDLNVIRQISSKIAVMYLGKIVESAQCGELFRHPSHPYTRMLLSSIPVLEPKKSMYLRQFESGIPYSSYTPSGCCFYPRCEHAMDVCKYVVPQLRIISGSHRVSCHMNNGFGLD